MHFSLGPGSSSSGGGDNDDDDAGLTEEQKDSKTLAQHQGCMQCRLQDGSCYMWVCCCCCAVAQPCTAITHYTSGVEPRHWTYLGPDFAADEVGATTKKPRKKLGPVTIV